MPRRDSSTPPNLVGRTIDGRYQVERVLGEGGFGTVYEVTHLRFGGRFAMKVLLPNALSNPEAVRRFQREARAAASIGHKHIVQVTDMGEIEAGEPYIVLEYLRGHSLAKELGEPRAVPPTFQPLPAARVLAIGAQCCDALAAAHAAGIVHRDLKPDNIFLVVDPSGTDFVKVLDFGISKFNEAAIGVGSVPLTVDGQMIGTPHYMSPEQVQGLASTDERTDVFSMGVLLYQCLTGELPFDANTLPALTLAIMMSEPPPPTTLRPELPSVVDEIVLRALGKSPDDRYPRMIEMGRALEAARRALEGRLSEPHDGPTAVVSMDDVRRKVIDPVRTAVLPVEADAAATAAGSSSGQESAPRGEPVWELKDRRKDVLATNSLAPTPQSWPRVSSSSEPVEKPRPWGVIVMIVVVVSLVGGALATAAWLASLGDAALPRPVLAVAPRPEVPPDAGVTAVASSPTPPTSNRPTSEVPSGIQDAGRAATSTRAGSVPTTSPAPSEASRSRNRRRDVEAAQPATAPSSPPTAPPSDPPNVRRRLSIRSEWPVAIDVTLHCGGEPISRRVPGRGAIAVDLPPGEACHLDCGTTNVGNPPCPGRVGVTSTSVVIGRGGGR